MAFTLSAGSLPEISVLVAIVIVDLYDCYDNF